MYIIEDVSCKQFNKHNIAEDKVGTFAEMKKKNKKRSYVTMPPLGKKQNIF